MRILRARPAFYPMVRDRYAGAVSPVVDTGAHVLPGHGRHPRGVFAAAAAAASGGHRGSRSVQMMKNHDLLTWAGSRS